MVGKFLGIVVIVSVIEAPSTLSSGQFCSSFSLNIIV